MGAAIGPVSKSEAAAAREAGERLGAMLGRGTRVRIGPADRPAEGIELPASAVRVLVRVLEQMGAGNAVTVNAVPSELTTQEAAEILGVSRPFVIRRMEAGELAHRKVGRHRRVRYEDLMEFKGRMDARERKAIEELMEEARRRGGGVG